MPDHPDGAIAQLGERLHGMQEVSGSIPLSSTTLSRSLITKEIQSVTSATGKVRTQESTGGSYPTASHWPVDPSLSTRAVFQPLQSVW